MGGRDGAAHLLRRLDRRRLTRLRHGWTDGGYRGPFLDWAQEHRGITFQVVQRQAADQVGVRRGPRRWVVERTFAWLGEYRRVSKDYEYLTATSEGSSTWP